MIARYEESLYEGERGLYDRFVRAFGVRPADNKRKDMRIANFALLAAQGDQKGH